MSLRFWFLLSYLITTVSFSIMICFEIMYWNEVACDLHSNKIYVSCITLYYVFKRSKLKIPSYFIYENNKYFYCHNSWNATTCIWCNKLEVDKKQYINEKKVIVCKIFWPFYQIDTPWSALCFNSELVVLFQVQFWSDSTQNNDKHYKCLKIFLCFC